MYPILVSFITILCKPFEKPFVMYVDACVDGKLVLRKSSMKCVVTVKLFGSKCENGGREEHFA